MKRGASRGVGISSASGGLQLDKDDFVADFLRALIRDLAPPISPKHEGDLPDIDEDELDPVKRPVLHPEAVPPLASGEWERLVTTCRQRIGVLIGRLSKRLNVLPTGPDAAASLAGKVLTVMCLLQKLRMKQPPEGSALNASHRLESLVAVSQLRSVFKVAMRAMYASGGLAEALEANMRWVGGSPLARCRDALGSTRDWCRFRRLQ
jgi:hypothetical protein